MGFVSEVDEEFLFSVEEAEWACYERDIDLGMHSFLFPFETAPLDFDACGRRFFGRGSQAGSGLLFGTGPLSDIKAVFANMWDGSNPTTIVSNMVLDWKDFSNQEPTHPTMAAYTIPGTGRFHVCAYGLQRPQLSEITCDSLDDSCSSTMRSIAMTLLHEMT